MNDWSEANYFPRRTVPAGAGDARREVNRLSMRHGALRTQRKPLSANAEVGVFLARALGR